MTSETLRAALAKCPLIAILRGISPEEAAAIGGVLVEAGFIIIEVPLNSPRPFESIARLAKAHPIHLIGAGTVMTTADVDRVADAGGRLIVMPHADLDIVRHARARNLLCLPGIATPSEGFAALRAGAHGLKLFPGEMLTPAVLKAMRAVFPKDTLMLRWAASAIAPCRPTGRPGPTFRHRLRALQARLEHGRDRQAGEDPQRGSAAAGR